MYKRQKQAEVAGCDSVTRITGKSYDNYMLQLGALAHIGKSVDFGLNVRLSLIHI